MQPLSVLSPHRLVLVVLPVLLLSPAWAGDTPMERASLKGVTSVQLLVEPIAPDAARDGLSATQLEADIELRLRQTALKVAPLANDVLQVQAITVKQPDGDFYAFTVSVVFHQVVVPLRHLQDQIQLSAATWSVAVIGVVPTGEVRSVRSHVITLVDKFIHAYREQNP